MRRFCIFAILLACPPALADEIAGPVAASVIRIIDGDTFVAHARVWPGHSVEVSVRIRGIDAPETRTRCAAEKQAGEAAASVLSRMIGEASVRLTRVGADKFYGRVVADVAQADGQDVATLLLGAGLVAAYDGGARAGLCSGRGIPGMEQSAGKALRDG